MRINVYRDGRVVVTKHPVVPVSVAMQFVERKLPWIRKRLEFYKTAKIYDWTSWQADEPQVALDFVKSKIDKFNQHYQFTVGEVQIKNYKRMWGVCSRRHDLSFNAKITGLPQEQADYIIVHELCHIGQFDHSKKFWELVAQTTPDYKRIKKDLKLYSFY